VEAIAGVLDDSEEFATVLCRNVAAPNPPAKPLKIKKRRRFRLIKVGD